MKNRGFTRTISIIFAVIFFLCAIGISVAMARTLIGIKEAEASAFLKWMNAVLATYKFSSLFVPLSLLYAAITLLIPGWSRHSRAILLAFPLVFICSVAGEYAISLLLPQLENPTIESFAKWTVFLLTALGICMIILFSHIASDKLFKHTSNVQLYYDVDIIGDEYTGNLNQNEAKPLNDEIKAEEESFFSLFKVKEHKNERQPIFIPSIKETSIWKDENDRQDMQAEKEAEQSERVEPRMEDITTSKSQAQPSQEILSQEVSMQVVTSSDNPATVDPMFAQNTEKTEIPPCSILSPAQPITEGIVDKIVEKEIVPTNEVNTQEVQEKEETTEGIEEKPVENIKHIIEKNIKDEFKKSEFTQTSVAKEPEIKESVIQEKKEESIAEEMVVQEREEKLPKELTANDITVSSYQSTTEEQEAPSKENEEQENYLSDMEELNKLEVVSFKPEDAPQIQEVKKGYHIPFDLLTDYPGNEYWVIDASTRKAAFALKSTLNEFKINVDITGIRKGPVVTMFEVLPPPGIKLAKITALQDNIALRLAAESVRIVAPIPGKRAVGIEIPNVERSIVGFRELIQTEHKGKERMAIPIVLGKDITGEPQMIDLAQTPHLLIAGATGAGKSVCVNSIILSILYNNRPDEVKLMLVDPKIVELKLYNDIAHLLTPVITEPKKAFQALQYCICEMERRYSLLDRISVRDIKSYNKKIKAEHLTMERLPYIVIIIDEFADLMATTGKELEGTVSRLCAMSRAVGIHLVLATQRPSADVITGLIKANIPSRIAFMVASRIDSRIILDDGGADKLLGKGDMLYVSPAKPWPTRIQGAFVSEDEVVRVVDEVKTFGEPDYIDDEIFMDGDEEPVDSFFGGESDPLYDEALDIVVNEGKASASYIQRRLKIGYNRAARIIDEMEMRGVVGPANGAKPREILQQF